MVQGDLTYTQTGIFDETHLHFYTPRELLKLSLETDLLCTGIKNILVPRQKSELAQQTSTFSQLSSQLTELYESDKSEIYQYVYYFRPGALSEETPTDQYLASLGVPSDIQDSPLDPLLWNIVVRYHADRLGMLSEALYSIAAQTYPHVKVILVGHTRNDDLVNKVDSLIKHFKDLLTIEHVTADPNKKRGHPLNVGLDHCTGAYVSFLDYDDRYYPFFGSILINELQRKSATFAFGATVKVCQEKVGDHYKTVSKEPRIETAFNPVRLATDNFIPINTFVYDFSQFRHIRFDESLDVIEDWDFLLQMLFSNKLIPALVRVPVSEYYVRNDNSNSVLNHSRQGQELPPESIHARKHIAAKFINKTYPMLYQDSFSVFPDYNRMLSVPINASEIGYREIQKRELEVEVLRLNSELANIRRRKGFRIYNRLLRLFKRGL